MEVLIIDDDEQICKFLSKVFSEKGYNIFYQQTLKDGLAKISAGNIDVVFLDVNLPDGNGLEAIKIIKEHPFAPEIIIITGDEDSEGAELAMQANAWDYISKTGSYKKFQFALGRALEYRKQKQSVQLQNKINRSSIIGESPLILACLDKVSKAANNDVPVLITGETGTGKELFSTAIHINSNRAHGSFVVVDCTALPEHLVESTLFGHVKGTFTGADVDKVGLMAMADKGTLFLDEVGELPLSTQKKFLRALQEKKIRPVGGKKEVKSDFRLICATHRDLKKMVEENKFRSDLFFRIFSMHIHLPALKDRKQDIKALVLHHLANKKAFAQEKLCKISEECFEEIKMYEWPGNVRELINTIDSVCSDAGDGSTVFSYHLPTHIRAFNMRNKFNSSKNSDTKVFSIAVGRAANKLKFKDYLEKMKYDYLQDLLSLTKGNIQESCKISGLSRSQIYRLIQQYNCHNN